MRSLPWSSVVVVEVVAMGAAAAAADDEVRETARISTAIMTCIMNGVEREILLLLLLLLLIIITIIGIQRNSIQFNSIRFLPSLFIAMKRKNERGVLALKRREMFCL
jgi:high-affinity nickel permease